MKNLSSAWLAKSESRNTRAKCHAFVRRLGTRGARLGIFLHTNGARARFQAMKLVGRQVAFPNATTESTKQSKNCNITAVT